MLLGLSLHSWMTSMNHKSNNTIIAEVSTYSTWWFRVRQRSNESWWVYWGERVVRVEEKANDEINGNAKAIMAAP